jgi:hypothetical protein
MFPLGGIAENQATSRLTSRQIIRYGSRGVNDAPDSSLMTLAIECVETLVLD